METKQITAALGGDTCEFRAVVASLGKIDHDDDIFAHGSFGEQVVPVLQGHDGTSRPLGKVNVREVGDEVVAEGTLVDAASCQWIRFDASTPPSRQEFSVGFIPLESRFDTVDGTKVRVIESVDLLEISLVLRGAQPDTRLLDVKAEKSCGCGCGGECKKEVDHPFVPKPSESAYLKSALRRWPGNCGYCGACPECKAVITADDPRRFPQNTDRYFETERLHWQSWTHAVAVEVARSADMPIPKVKFFAESEHWSNPGEFDNEDLELRGLFDPATNTVWLNDTLSRDQMLTTLGHELAHAHQRANKRKSSERAADKVAAKVHALYKRDVQRHETRAMRELTA